MENGVEVKKFPDNLERKIQQDNAKLIKEKDAEAIQTRKAKPLSPKSILENPAPEATNESFSTTAIREFLKESSAKFKYPSAEFNSRAEEIPFVERSADGKAVTPTRLGLMLFGTAPENQFP